VLGEDAFQQLIRLVYHNCMSRGLFEAGREGLFLVSFFSCALLLALFHLLQALTQSEDQGA
jgi:hypothetical protein